MVLTNQEGKLYYVTSFNYFIDLADIDLEFDIRGHLRKYKEENIMENHKFEIGLATKKEPDMKKEDVKNLINIAQTDIPKGRYYLKFTMCLISMKSFKY